MTIHCTCDPETMGQTRMQKRARRTRERLLEGALAVFVEKGIEAATIQDITEKADLGKGTFYRHFTTKDEVAAELIATSASNLLGECRKATAGKAGLREVLAALLRAHASYFSAHRQEFLVLFQGRLLPKLQRDQAAGLEKPLVDYLRDVEGMLATGTGQRTGPAKVRTAASALSAYVAVCLSFVTIGVPFPEIETSLESLRNAHVSALMAFLTDSSTPAVVPPQAGGPSNLAGVRA